MLLLLEAMKFLYIRRISLEILEGYYICIPLNVRKWTPNSYLKRQNFIPDIKRVTSKNLWYTPKVKVPRRNAGVWAIANFTCLSGEWSCNSTSTYYMISSSIQLLLTCRPTIGSSYYFINPTLLKQELFSAINKSIRQWPKILRDFSP